MVKTRRVAWWGKLPARGDFVGRGLPPRWRGEWDDWLQRGLALAGGQMDRDTLRERLSAFAPWRYAALPAADECWCGILVPSQDRVGRAFPLTLVERAASPALAPACAVRLAPLLDAAREGPEALELAIAAMPAFDAHAGAGPEVLPQPPCSLWWPLAAPDDAAPVAATWPPEPALMLALLAPSPACGRGPG